MPELPDEFRDQIIVRHPNDQSDKISAPDDPEAVVRIGRELDNDIVLTDPRSSRYHAELRRAPNGNIEIKDLESANGVLVGVTRIKAGTWEKVDAGQVVQFGETRLYWEMAASSQSTIAMTPVQKEKAAEQTTVTPRQAAPPKQQEEKTTVLPWLIGAGVVVVILLLVGIIGFFFFNSDSTTDSPAVVEVTAEATEEPAAEAATTEESPERDEANLTQQTPGSGPTDTPTPAGPQLAIPVIEVISSEVRPIILGALPSTDKALYLVNVRVQNLETHPLPFRPIISPSKPVPARSFQKPGEQPANRD